MLITFKNQREKEVFMMVLKDASLNEVRDDVLMEAYDLWQKLTKETQSNDSLIICT